MKADHKGYRISFGVDTELDADKRKIRYNRIYHSSNNPVPIKSLLPASKGKKNKKH